MTTALCSRRYVGIDHSRLWDSLGDLRAFATEAERLANAQP
jgi:hypothetical protein